MWYSRPVQVFNTLVSCDFFLFFFNDTATTEIYTLSLHDALPLWSILLVRRRVDRNLAGYVAGAIEVRSHSQVRPFVEFMAHREASRIKGNLIAFVVPRIDQHQQARVQVKGSDISNEHECGSRNRQDHNLASHAVTLFVGLEFDRD